MSTRPPNPVTKTTRREATIVLRFVETISEVYAAPESEPAFPAHPGLAKVANVVRFPLARRAGAGR